MKRCPYCAEEIQDDAKKCRFCGEFLKKRKRWVGCLIGCLVTLLGAIISLVLFFYLSFLLFKFVLHKLFFPAPQVHPPLYYSPFGEQGTGNMFQSFGEFLRSFWDKIMYFMHNGLTGQNL